MCLGPSHSHYERVSWLFSICDFKRNRAESRCVSFHKTGARQQDFFVFSRYFNSQLLHRGMKKVLKRIQSEKARSSWPIPAVYGAVARFVGHGWIVISVEAAELRTRTLSEWFVRLYVVHLPPGLLSLCFGLSELVCRCVIVSGTGSRWSVHSSDRIWIGQNRRMLQLRQEENVAFNR